MIKQTKNELPKRKTIRLQEYDYSEPGGYFVTICMQDRICRLGNITDGEMILSECGKMVKNWILKLPDKFGNIQLDEFVIMPNHIHMILFIEEPGGHMGPQKPGGHMGPPLHKVVQWLKTMTTNEYIRNVKKGKRPRFNKRVWQRNYYEHIVRNEKDLDKTREYIRNNPLQWEIDKHYCEN